LPVLHAKDEALKKEPTDKVQKELGAPMLRILAGATRVECFRIDPHGTDAGDGKPTGKHIDGYPITVTAKEQGREFAAKLAAALQDEKSIFSPQARCFFPGVGFRIWSGKESVDVIVCYMCSGLRLVARDSDGKVLGRAGGGFSGNWALFVQLAKEAFPDDAEIQKLDAKDSRKGSESKTGL
jgi:hypothetical protein